MQPELQQSQVADRDGDIPMDAHQVDDEHKMPSLETGTTDQENDGDEVSRPVIVPTMPIMSNTMPAMETVETVPDMTGNSTDSVQSAVNMMGNGMGNQMGNDNAETPEAGNGDGATLTQQNALSPPAHQEQEQSSQQEVQQEQGVGHGLNMLNAMQPDAGQPSQDQAMG